MSFSRAFNALSKTNALSGTEGNLIRSTILSATGTLTYTSVPANATQDQTITVPGATFGDFILLGKPILAAGLQTDAFVSAANTVSVRVVNETISAIVPGALVFNVAVIKP